MGGNLGLVTTIKYIRKVINFVYKNIMEEARESRSALAVTLS